MLTTCPHCQAWFRVRSEHLIAANGVVTCGKCDRVFSALASLVDESTFAAVEPVARPDATAPTPGLAAPGPGLAASASELRADQAETAPVELDADDEPVGMAGDAAAAAIAQEDDAPLWPPAAIPGAEEDSPVGLGEVTADAPAFTPAAAAEPAAEAIGEARADAIDEPPDAADVSASMVPVEPVAESGAKDIGEARADAIDEPPAAAAVSASMVPVEPVAEPAAEAIGEARADAIDEPPDAGADADADADPDADPDAVAATTDPAAAPEADSELLETVITRVPPSPEPIAPAALPCEASSGPEDDGFSPGATAFTRAYAAFEDTDAHGEDLEFVFADDDDLDATLHMGRPDLRVEPPESLVSAAEAPLVAPTFDLADPEPEDVRPPIDLGAFADDDDLDATLHMGRPDLRVEPPASPAAAADAPLVAPTFDLADPEPGDTAPPAGTGTDRSASVAGEPGTDIGLDMAIDRDAALDFGGLDALPRPAEPVDDVSPVHLPEDDAVLASLLDDPALSPAARAALASTLAAEAAAENDAVADEGADAAGTLPRAGVDLAAGAETSPLGLEAPEMAAAPASADEGEQASTPLAGAIADLPATAGDEPRSDDEPPSADATATPDVPPALLDDLRALETPRRTRRSGWTAFALVLLVLGLGQGAFVGRERLLTWVPAAAPAIDFLCARLPCAERRVEGAVRLLARDVREHPQYRDALLVNATIVNDGAVPTPYPVIDLRLRDAAGNVLAARQFQPDDYLDQSIDQAQGMPAGRPIYVVLELAGDARAAVSFEFTFL